jgi:hypothetical protein
VFKVQDEIAAAVVKSLQLKLLSTAPKTESEPHNTDAYSLYLQGQYFARRASDVDVERGIASHEQAIALVGSRRRASFASAVAWSGSPARRQAQDVRNNLAILEIATRGASYPVLVHRLVRLLHASFRSRLTATPLRSANPSPPSGWVEDFHLRAVVHARHTKPGGLAPAG